MDNLPAFLIRYTKLPKLLNMGYMLFDASLKGIESLCCGANEPDYHYIGFQIERDLGQVEYHDLAKAVSGGICPECGSSSLCISRGVEVGHIFKLGTKYSKTMNMQYSDDNGILQNPVMGCYGIGIGRLAAAVCELRHDEFGPLWPISIAPWQVHLCCVRADDEQVRAFADNLYEQLLSEKIEVIYDDRVISAGVMFSDADLLGVPVRVIASPRNMKNGGCEIVTRDKRINKVVDKNEIVISIKKLLNELQKEQIQ